MNATKLVRLTLDQARIDCYTNYTAENFTAESSCGLFFDGLMCWSPTPAGTTRNLSCSTSYMKSTLDGFATRQCTDSGEWFKLPSSGQTWTNYTQCGNFYIEIGHELNPDHEIYMRWLPVIKSITHFGFILSIITLLISLFIFLYIKRLHCARNMLHINLFVSFVMRALMSLIKDALFVKGTALAQDVVYINGEPTFNKEYYSWPCKAIVSLRNYFIVSNYMFILMEGTYLHNLMFLNLFAENGVSIYCLVGWSLPALFVIPWIILKALDENTYCWTQRQNKYISLLIDVPVGITVLINFILFVIIIRILSIKLTSMYIQQRKVKYRKLLRATLILVPLFGIPYTISEISSFYVSKNQTLEIIWLFLDQTFTSLQGFFASLVYCLLNNEVQVEIQRKWTSIKDRHPRDFKRNRTISHTQQIPLNEELQEIETICVNKDPLIKKTSDYF